LSGKEGEDARVRADLHDAGTEVSRRIGQADLAKRLLRDTVVGFGRELVPE